MRYTTRGNKVTDKLMTSFLISWDSGDLQRAREYVKHLEELVAGALRI